MKHLLLIQSLLLSLFLFGQKERFLNKKNSHLLVTGYDFKNNGKSLSKNKMTTLFEEDTTINKTVIANNSNLIEALKVNLAYLKRKGNKNASSLKGLSYNYQDLLRANQCLLNEHLDTVDFSKLHLQKIWGEDQKGNVLYTSYYIPIVDVRLVKDSVFRFPIYKKPENKYLKGLTRKNIDQKKMLYGKNLELAYAKSYFDIYSMQVQGSAYVRFKNGATNLFSYGGMNNKPYFSIGKYLTNTGAIAKDKISLQSIDAWFKSNPDSINILMKNQSYVYFKKSEQKPKGAAGIPLSEFISIACDFKYLPKGSILLGEVPVLDSYGNLIKHEYRILIAQDTGGAIKGPGHIDLYAGVGSKAADYAGKIKHYGRLWLILP